MQRYELFLYLCTQIIIKNMKKEIIGLAMVALLAACADGRQKEADALLQQANALFEQLDYDRALSTIDSLRDIYPNAIDTRKRALRLYQSIELRRSQEELARVDSSLEAAKQSYAYLQRKVEQDKAVLAATPEELTELTLLRMKRDSLQTRFDVLCAKIRYIHKKQKD